MKIVFAGIMLAVTIGAAQAQDGPTKKKAAVAAAKVQVAADKADVEMNKQARHDDKARGDKQALKADRKAMVEKKGTLLKDQVKKDVKVVKEKL